MKYFIKRFTFLVLTLFLTFSVLSIAKTKVIAGEQIKITVDEYVANKDAYDAAPSCTYIICGIIEDIFLTNKDKGLHTFRLKSLNPFSNNYVNIITKVDSIIYDSKTTYNGFYVYTGNLGLDTGKGKYIEFKLDNTAYSEATAGYENSKGRVVCEARYPTIQTSNDFTTALNTFKNNKVKTSLRFDYDSTTGISESSTTTWTLVTSKDQITDDGIYTFGEMYDNNSAVKFTTDPLNYTVGDIFDHSVARLTSNSFTIVYPTVSPAEFKITKKTGTSYYNVTYKSILLNERAEFNTDQYRLRLNSQYGEFIKIEDYNPADTTSNFYLFKKTSTSSERNKTIEYDPNSVSIRFLSYIDDSSDCAIRTGSDLVKSITYGMKLSIEGKEDQFIDFSESEISRVDEAGSNTKVLEGGVLQTILKVKGIPYSKWQTNITATPYIKVVLNPYTLPTDNNISFDFGTYYFYQESSTWTVKKLAENYYLNYGSDVGVASHLYALKEIIDGSAKERKAK